MFSLFAPRENRLPVAFLENFRTSQFPWTLLATGGHGRAPVATFPPTMHGAAAAWIAKAQKQRRNVLVLMAETNGAVTGVMLVRGHLRGSRHFGVKLPMAKAEVLEAFKPKPFLRLHAGNRLYAAWRLINEVPVEAVEATANAVAAKLGGVSIGHLLPLAGTMHEGTRVELFHLYKDRFNVLTDFHDPEAAREPTAKAFVRASDVQAKQLSWLWRGAVLRGAMSLLAGPGGVGKSTVAASIAATVTTGGAWPDGEQAPTGGVIFCEGEDDPESVTLPRLQAAGADLSRLVIGPVCDLSQGVERLDAAAKTLGSAPALLVLSPVRSFFGKESFLDTEVRARLAPVLAWAERHNVAILGISHPPRDKRGIAGAGAWTNAARAGFFVEKDKRRPSRRILLPLKANSGRDDWQLAYIIEGAKLRGGIETSRVVWQGENAREVHRGELRPVPEPVKPKRRITRQLKPDMTNVVQMPARASDAAVWLRAALADGPRDAAQLKREALQVGISKGSIYRAVKQLDVVIESTPNSSARDAKTWRNRSVTNLSLPVAHFCRERRTPTDNGRSRSVDFSIRRCRRASVGTKLGNEFGQRRSTSGTACSAWFPTDHRRMKSAVGQRRGQRNVAINLGNDINNALGNDPTARKCRRSSVGVLSAAVGIVPLKRSSRAMPDCETPMKA